jgi:uncharacterized membrane protein YqiK
MPEDMATLVAALASLIVAVGVLVISVGIFYLVVRLGRAVETLVSSMDQRRDNQSPMDQRDNQSP